MGLTQSSALASALVAGKSIRIEDVGRDCDQAWRVHRLKKGFRCLPMFLGVPNFPVSFALFPIAARRTLHEVSEPALDNEVLLEQVLCTEAVHVGDVVELLLRGEFAHFVFVSASHSSST